MLLLAVISTGGKAIATVDNVPQPAHRAASASTGAQGDLQRPAAATPAGQARQAIAASASDGAQLTPLPSSEPTAFAGQASSGRALASARTQGDFQRPAGAAPAGQARRATATSPSDGARLTPLPSSSPEALVVQTASGGAPMSPEPGGAQPAAPTSLHGALARAIQTLAKSA